MRRGLILLGLLLWATVPARAELNIGFNVSLFPQLVMVPGYPVYYAPDLEANYFFYDGAYWVYQGDDWYSSSWYNGPWELMDREFVPLYVLRVPVRYYRRPPQYFRDWQGDAPPRWGDHWGGNWSQRHSGWDRWDRRSAPAPAPLPVYQRQYSGARYPSANRQRELQSGNYHRQAPAERDGQRGGSSRAPQRAAPTSVTPASQRPMPRETSRSPASRGPAPARSQPQPAQSPRAQVQSPRQQAPTARQQPERRQQAPEQQPQNRQGQPGSQQPRRGQKPAQDQAHDQGDKRGDRPHQ